MGLLCSLGCFHGHVHDVMNWGIYFGWEAYGCTTSGECLMVISRRYMERRLILGLGRICLFFLFLDIVAFASGIYPAHGHFFCISLFDRHLCFIGHSESLAISDQTRHRRTSHVVMEPSITKKTCLYSVDILPGQEAIERMQMKTQTPTLNSVLSTLF